MVWVPGGLLQMGSEEKEDEKPVHEVPVKGFWIYRFPVTQALFTVYMNAVNNPQNPSVRRPVRWKRTSPLRLARTTSLRFERVSYIRRPIVPLAPTSKIFMVSYRSASLSQALSLNQRRPATTRFNSCSIAFRLLISQNVSLPSRPRFTLCLLQTKLETSLSSPTSTTGRLLWSMPC